MKRIANKLHNWAFSLSFSSASSVLLLMGLLSYMLPLWLINLCQSTFSAAYSTGFGKNFLSYFCEFSPLQEPPLRSGQVPVARVRQIPYRSLFQHCCSRVSCRQRNQVEHSCNNCTACYEMLLEVIDKHPYFHVSLVDLFKYTSSSPYMYSIKICSSSLFDQL